VTTRAWNVRNEKIPSPIDPPTSASENAQTGMCGSVGVSEARSAFVVLDTAPTGHSLLLMDALVQGEVGDTARIRDLLGRSEAPGSVRGAIGDPSLPLYEKRGWYDGVENDVARLDLGHGAAFTLAVFAPDVAESASAWALFADLAHLGIETGGGR